MEKELEKLVNDKILKWLPWVGENYDQNKILFLGESHRYNDDENSFEKHNNSNFTRDCVKDMGVNKNEDRVSFYKNTHGFFEIENQTQSNSFWNKVAFMNIVQSPMRHVGNDRKGPNNQDFNNGWASVLKTLEVLKPEIIICLSLSGADKMKKAVKKSSFNLDLHQWDYKINGIWAKKAIISNSSKQNLKIVFLKHPSVRGGNAFEEWRNFLKSEISSDHFEKLFSH